MEVQGLEARPPRFATYPGLDIRTSVARNRDPRCIATASKFCEDIVCSCCEVLMFKYLAVHPRICLCCQSSSPDAPKPTMNRRLTQAMAILPVAVLLVTAKSQAAVKKQPK